MMLDLQENNSDYDEASLLEWFRNNQTVKEENQNTVKMVTPKKSSPSNETEQPLTPTANLKMLVCAASVASPVKNEEDNDGSDDGFEPPIDPLPPKNKKQKKFKRGGSIEQKCGDQTYRKFVSRKQKSLGLLCTRFLETYPSDKYGTELCIDDVTRQLGVERRRVYDIVNVLESMEMMTKLAKNSYRWHGPAAFSETLSKLKAIALKTCNFNDKGEAFFHKDPEDLSKLHKNTTVECNAENENLCPGKAEQSTDIKETIEDRPNIEVSAVETAKKGRSLGIMCQKFLMLFIIKQDHTVSLEYAANTLIQPEETDTAKHKTKVRRLYDIANILSSMNFVEKIIVYDQTTRATAFKWTGVDLDQLQPDQDILNGFQLFLGKSSKQSILTTKVQTKTRQRKLYERSSSTSIIKSDKKKPFARSLSAAFIERAVKKTEMTTITSKDQIAAEISKKDVVNDCETIDQISLASELLMSNYCQESEKNILERCKRRSTESLLPDEQQASSSKQIKVTMPTKEESNVNLTQSNIPCQFSMLKDLLSQTPTTNSNELQSFINDMSQNVVEQETNTPVLKHRSRSWPICVSQPISTQVNTSLNQCLTLVGSNSMTFKPILLSSLPRTKSTDYIQFLPVTCPNNQPISIYPKATNCDLTSNNLNDCKAVVVVKQTNCGTTSTENISHNLNDLPSCN